MLGALCGIWDQLDTARHCSVACSRDLHATAYAHVVFAELSPAATAAFRHIQRTVGVPPPPLPTWLSHPRRHTRPDQ